jgi:hypothetical protein
MTFRSSINYERCGAEEAEGIEGGHGVLFKETQPISGRYADSHQDPAKALVNGPSVRRTATRNHDLEQKLFQGPGINAHGGVLDQK